MNVNPFWAGLLDSGLHVEICHTDFTERIDRAFWAIKARRYETGRVAMPTSADRPRRRMSAQDRERITLSVDVHSVQKAYRCVREIDHKLVSSPVDTTSVTLGLTI